MPWHVSKQKRGDRTYTPGVELRGQYSRTRTIREKEKPINTIFAIRHSIAIHSPSPVTGNISDTYSLCILHVPARVARHSSNSSKHEDKPAVWLQTRRQNKGRCPKRNQPPFLRPFFVLHAISALSVKLDMRPVLYTIWEIRGYQGFCQLISMVII